MVSDSSAERMTDRLESRLRDGEEDVLADLFLHYRTRLLRMIDFRIDHRLRGRLDPSDVVQEAFLAASQRLQSFRDRPGMSFYVWLREVTLQRMFDVHRRHLLTQKRNAGQEVSLHAWSRDNSSASLAHRLAARMTTPSQCAMQEELAARLRDSLGAMQPIDREVLALRHFEELTNDEVAELLDLSKAAASNRYVRALSRLKQILESVPGFFDALDDTRPTRSE